MHLFHKINTISNNKSKFMQLICNLKITNFNINNIKMDMIKNKIKVRIFFI